jgi:hypothetical protein
MLLKLLLPYYDRSVEEGVIRAWHKKEGDWVNYGDDLFDLDVEELRHMRNMPSGRRQVEMMSGPQALARLRRLNELMMKPIEPNEGAYERITAHVVLRVTSSDAGVLRRIRAPEGQRRKVGDLLALLATDENDPLPGPDDPLTEVSAFRTVASFVTPAWGEMP